MGRRWDPLGTIFLLFFSFLDALDRINDENFVPTVQDVLMSRVPTLGVHEIHFNLKGLNFR